MNLPRTLTHDAAHEKVALRVDAYEAMPVRSPRGSGPHGRALPQGTWRLRRREAYKAAVWAVAWHLRHHGWKRIVGPPLTLPELQAIHDRYHEEEQS